MIQNPDHPNPSPSRYINQFNKSREITPETQSYSQQRKENFEAVLPILKERLVKEGILDVTFKIVGSVAEGAAEEKSDIDLSVVRMTWAPNLNEVMAYQIIRRVADEMYKGGIAQEGLTPEVRLKYPLEIHEVGHALRHAMDMNVRLKLLAEFRNKPH